MRKIVLTILVFCMIISSSSCLLQEKEELQEFVTIPDISGTDTESAKEIIISIGLIPNVEYEYDDFVEEGNVIDTYPKNGEIIERNNKITIFVSKGAVYFESKNSNISWYNVSYGDDDWNFCSPYIERETLYIECEACFSTNVEWLDNEDSGFLFGRAAINDTFDKSVPVSAQYETKICEKNEPQSFTLEIPISDLNQKRPTTMYVELYAAVDGYEETIDVNFTMTW